MKKHYVKILIHLFIIAFLTVVTQVGGVIWFFILLFFGLVERKKKVGLLPKLFYFVIIYFLVSYFALPPLAKSYGREPLPVFDNYLQPRTFLTVATNRHYVKTALAQILASSAKEMQEEFPGTVTLYLDAGFPFFDNFPLVPHLSHADGKKVDLAFYYQEKDGMQVNTTPSPIGYGIYETPAEGEEDMPDKCGKDGYRKYNALYFSSFQDYKKNLKFDTKRTKHLIRLLAKQPEIQKIFIEPHLVKRMNCASEPKIRFHGCHSIRHDDHIHTQIK